MEAVAAKQPFEIADVNRLIVVRHGNPFNGARFDSQVSNIVRNTRFHTVETVLTEPRMEDTLDKLHARCGEGDLLYVLGGDGTANSVLQYAGDKDTPTVAVAFSDSGSTNNAYHATADKDSNLAPSERLNSGRLVAVTPLRGTIISGRETTRRLAWNIVSLGAIATGAEVLNDPRYRQRRLWKNDRTRLAYKTFISFTRALPRTRTLQVLESLSPGAQPLLEQFIARGPLIADVVKLDSEMTDGSYLAGSIRDQLPWHLAPAIAGLLRGTFPYERRDNGDGTIAYTLTESRRNRAARMQFDGEAVAVAAGNIIRLDQPRHDDTYHRYLVPVLSTRLAAA